MTSGRKNNNNNNDDAQNTEYPSDVSELTGLDDRKADKQKQAQPVTFFDKIMRLVSNAPEAEQDRARALRRAVRAQDHSKVSQIIAQGVAVNEQQESSLACIAARRADMDMMKILVKAGVDINKSDRRSQNSKARTPIQDSARKGWFKGVQFLVSMGADIDACELGDVTALQMACRLGHSEIIDLLLMNGADPNGSKGSHTTPLHETASPEIFKKLLSNGANPSLTDSNKCTPLHLQAYHGRFENVKILLSFPGIDFNALDRKGRPPVFLVGSRGDAIKTYAIFKELGINFNKKDMSESNLAHAISNRAQTEDLIMEVFTDAPQLWTAKNMSGQTPVDVLSIRGFVALAAKIRLMIEDAKFLS